MQSNFDIRGVTFSGCGLCGQPMPECSCNREALKREAAKPPPLSIRMAQGLTSRAIFDQSRLGISSFHAHSVTVAAGVSVQASLGIGQGAAQGAGIGGPSGGDVGGPS
jgi:hypothetical protein